MATKKAKTKGYTGPMDRLAAVVMGQAKVAGGQLADPTLDPKRRALLERRLLKAYEALWPTWSWSIVHAAVITALEMAAGPLRGGKWTETRAADRALELVAGTMNDQMAPPELARRVPKRALVLDYLRASASRRGAPKKGAPSRSSAILALFKDLGISGATTTASVNKMLARKRLARRNR